MGATLFELLKGGIKWGNRKRRYWIPIWQKELLSVKEAAAYFGIGENKIREMTAGVDNPYVLWVGNKRMIKRKLMESYIEEAIEI